MKLNIRNLAKTLQLKKEIKHTSEFYPSQQSCQIPNLDFLYRKFLGERDFGLFVEIGANDGVSCSNTWGLAARSWNGFMVEPIPKFAQLCRENHKNHPLVSIHQCAIGEQDGENLKLSVAGMLTTANPNLKAEYINTPWARNLVTDQYMEIKSKKLDSFLAENCIKPNFDVLVVDVEGYETNVFAGFSLNLWNPKMLIVEIADLHPDLNSTSIAAVRLGRQILSLGYSIAFKDSINTIFVKDETWDNAFKGS